VLYTHGCMNYVLYLIDMPIDSDVRSQKVGSVRNIVSSSYNRYQITGNNP